MEEILGLVFVFFIICFVWGIIKEGVKFIGSYIIEVLISAFICALVAWIFGGIWIGAVVGAIYCIFCWIFGKKNYITNWFFGARY